MLSLLLLLAVSDDLATFTLPTEDRLRVTCTTGCSAKTDYRVPRDDTPDVSAKDRAFRYDAAPCSTVGDKYCLSRGRTVFTTDFSD